MRMVTIRHDLLSSIILKAMSKAGLVARGEWLVEGDTSKRMDILLFNAGKKWCDLSAAKPQALLPELRPKGRWSVREKRERQRSEMEKDSSET